MVHQRNSWILVQSGFSSSFDAPWSEWSWNTNPIRNIPKERTLKPYSDYSSIAINFIWANFIPSTKVHTNTGKRNHKVEQLFWSLCVCLRFSGLRTLALVSLVKTRPLTTKPCVGERLACSQLYYSIEDHTTEIPENRAPYALQNCLQYMLRTIRLHHAPLKLLYAMLQKSLSQHSVRQLPAEGGGGGSLAAKWLYWRHSPFPHHPWTLPPSPKFCINYCFQILLPGTYSLRRVAWNQTP